MAPEIGPKSFGSFEKQAPGVVKKMPGEFTATDSFFSLVPVIVKTEIKGCLALSNIL